MAYLDNNIENTENIVLEDILSTSTSKVKETTETSNEYTFSKFCEELISIKTGDKKTKKFVVVKILDYAETISKNGNKYFELMISDGKRSKLCKLFSDKGSQLCKGSFYKINLSGIKSSFFEEVLFMDPIFEELSEQEVACLSYDQEYDLKDKKEYCKNIISSKILQITKLENFKSKMEAPSFTLDQKDLTINSVEEEIIDYQKPIVVFLKDLEERTYRLNLWPEVAKKYGLNLSTVYESSMISLKNAHYTRGSSTQDLAYVGVNLFSEIQLL